MNDDELDELERFGNAGISAILAGASVMVAFVTLAGHGCDEPLQYGLAVGVMWIIFLIGLPLLIPTAIAGVAGYHFGRRGVIGAAITFIAVLLYGTAVLLTPHTTTHCALL